MFETSEPFSDLKHILHVSHKLFPLVHIDRQRANHILVTAHEAVRTEYSIYDAVRWADGFVMPPEVHTADLQELIALGHDFPDLVRRKQSRNMHSRLSCDRLHSLWDSTDPDFDTLCEFARDGVHVMTSPTFVPHREDLEDSSLKCLIAYPAVNKLIYDSYKTGLAVILPSHCIAQLPANLPIHKSRLGHTLKKGKPQGRVTCNYSYGQPLSRRDRRD